MRTRLYSVIALTAILSASSAYSQDDVKAHSIESIYQMDNQITGSIAPQKSKKPQAIQQENSQMTSIYNDNDVMFPSYALIGNDDGRNGSSTSYSSSPEVSMDPKFSRQEVDFQTKEPAGSIIVNTDERMLYFILGNGKAMRYGVGVGRPGFEWGGVQRISRKAEWPDWRPPVEMLERRPDLPRYMPGGPDNPLGARAMYLGSSLYRIHGTNEQNTIGAAVSSGCIRMRNEDVEDLYTRAKIGAKVVVL